MEPFGKRRARHYHPIEYAGNPSFQTFHRLDISANAAPDYPIRLETLAAPIFKYSIRLDILANAAPDYPILLNMPTTHPPNHSRRLEILAMGEKLPQRGFTLDSPGLPTIGGYPG